MHSVMRRLAAAGLCAALQVGAFQAPLVHGHFDEDHDHHHQMRAVHAHFNGHARGPAEAEHHASEYVASGFSRTKDTLAITSLGGAEQATRLQIFVAVSAAACVAPALPPSRFVLAPAPQSAMRRPPEVVRSHGPPVWRATPPRAPPSFSV